MEIISSRHKMRGLPTAGRRWASRSVNPYVYVALVLVLFFGMIQGFQRAGLWTTSSRVTVTGERVVATGKDPAEVKGWMMIGEVLTAYGVPPEEFNAQFTVPADLPGTTQLKEIEKAVPGVLPKRPRV